MADNNPALEQTQQQTLNTLQVIRNELMVANGFDEKAMDARAENNRQMIELQGLYEEAEKNRSNESKELTESTGVLGFLQRNGNKALKSINGFLGRTEDDRLRTQKAMKSLLIDKPSAMLKSLGDKTAKFATDILKLLLTGGILFGLYKLLEWLSEQDPMELYNKAKKAFEYFTTEYLAFIEGIRTLAASVVVWKTVEFLAGFGKGPLWLLWTSIKAIFGAGGKFAVLAGSVVLWASNLMFGESGALRKTWSAVRKIFGAAGLFYDLLQIVTKWAGSVIFDIAKGPVVMVWNGIKEVFGKTGKMGLLLTEVVDKFKEFTGFGPEGIFRRMIKGIKTFFGPTGKMALMFTDVVDTLKDFTGFGPEGAFQKMVKGIKNFFGIGGTIAKSPGFLATAEDLVDLKKMGLDEVGPFKRMINGIKNIFGPGGKIANGFKTISALIPDFTGEKGVLTKVFNSISGIFGENSKLSTLSTQLSEWGTKFKNFFSFAPVEDADKPKGSAISKFFSFIGGIFGKFGGMVKAIFNNPVVTGIKTFVTGSAKWIGRIFAPIGWIMGFVEAVTGFWGGFKKRGKGDSRSLGDRLMDGLAGAIDGLVQFLFVDTLVLFQDILNFAVRKLNSFLTPEPGSVFGKFLDKIGLTDFKIKEFTFGTDMGKATTELIKDKIGSGKLDSEGNLISPLEEKVAPGPPSGNEVQVAQNISNSTSESKVFLKKDSKDRKIMSLTL